MNSERKGFTMRLLIDKKLTPSYVMQVAGLVAVVSVAIAVWIVRTSPPTLALGDKSYDEVIYDIDQRLQKERGDVCGESVTISVDGDEGSHGLAADSELPAKVTALLVSADVGPLSAFELKRIDAKGVLLVSEDATSEVLAGGRDVLSKAIQFTFVTGGAEGSSRWEITAESSFYACTQSEE